MWFIVCLRRFEKMQFDCCCVLLAVCMLFACCGLLRCLLRLLQCWSRCNLHVAFGARFTVFVAVVRRKCICILLVRDLWLLV